MNIFISFSGAAREEFAIKFLNLLNKYGLYCWYDQHELLLGDFLDDTITRHGIETAEYCILIINKSYLSREWPCEEAVRLYDKLKDRKTNVYAQ
ncbi:toll/interleukin-1 receptor domain-containing protein, partial [Treponema sp. R80B11-R83G3]